MGRGSRIGGRFGSSTGKRSPGRGKGRKVRPLLLRGSIWRLSSTSRASEKNWRRTPAPALEAPPTSQRPATRWELMPGPASGVLDHCLSTRVVPSTVTPSPGWGSAANTAALASVLPATTWQWAGKPKAFLASGDNGPSSAPEATTSGRAPLQGCWAMAPCQRLWPRSQPRRRLFPSSPKRQSPRSHPLSQSA